MRFCLHLNDKQVPTYLPCTMYIEEKNMQIDVRTFSLSSLGSANKSFSQFEPILQIIGATEQPSSERFSLTYGRRTFRRCVNRTALICRENLKTVEFSHFKLACFMFSKLFEIKCYVRTTNTFTNRSDFRGKV